PPLPPYPRDQPNPPNARICTAMHGFSETRFSPTHLTPRPAPHGATPRHIPARAPAQYEPTFPTQPPKNVPKCPKFSGAFRAPTVPTKRYNPLQLSNTSDPG